MSLLGDLFKEIAGATTVQHPCSNCPSNCQMYPNACEVCKPYKEKILDALYGVEHKDEIAAKYEVVSDIHENTGTIVCPHCGGSSENHYVCDYCGSKLQEGSQKIQVKSAADIPNPVMDCQDLIFARYDAVNGYGGSTGDMKDVLETIYSLRTRGLLGTILKAVNEVRSAESVIGSKMSEFEIEEMANAYGVSEVVYLAGLDNGKYLTKSARLAYQKAQQMQQMQRTMTMGNMGSGLGRTVTVVPMQSRPMTMRPAPSRAPMHHSPQRGGGMANRNVRRPGPAMRPTMGMGVPGMGMPGRPGPGGRGGMGGPGGRHR